MISKRLFKDEFIDLFISCHGITAQGVENLEKGLKKLGAKNLKVFYINPRNIGYQGWEPTDEYDDWNDEN